MKLPALIFALCAIAVPLRASETVKVTTYDQAAVIRAALGALDGYQKDVPQGTDQPHKVIFVYYEFSGKTRLAISRDLAALDAAIKPYEETRKAIVAAYDLNNPKVSPENTAKGNKEWEDAKKPALSATLEVIPSDDLKLDTNQIPNTILEQLLPILK